MGWPSARSPLDTGRVSRTLEASTWAPCRAVRGPRSSGLPLPAGVFQALAAAVWGTGTRSGLARDVLTRCGPAPAPAWALESSSFMLGVGHTLSHQLEARRPPWSLPRFQTWRISHESGSLLGNHMVWPQPAVLPERTLAFTGRRYLVGLSLTVWQQGCPLGAHERPQAPCGPVSRALTRWPRGPVHAQDDEQSCPGAAAVL